MEKTLTFLLTLFAASAFSQPVIEWQRALGGNANDYGYSIQPTSEGDTSRLATPARPITAMLETTRVTATAGL